MNESQAKTFVRVAACGSMSRAAESLFITQPAVKKQMDALEAELGVRLLERTPRGCAPTEAGAYLARELQELGEQLEAVKARAYSLGRADGTLRLCVLPHALSPGFERVSRAFARAHPEVELAYVPMAYADRPRALAEGRADVGIYFDDPAILRENGLMFWGAARPQVPQAPCLCLMGQDNPLVGSARITPDDLRGAPVAVFDRASFRGLAELLAGPGEKPAPLRAFSGDDFEVLGFCNAGGVYLCRHLVDRYETLRAVPFDYPMPPEGVITRRDPSPTARWFVDAVSEVLGDG